MGRSGHTSTRARTGRIPARERVASSDSRWRPEQIEEARAHYLAQGLEEIICVDCDTRTWMPHGSQRCTTCLRATGWSLGSEIEDPARRGEPRLVGRSLRNHLPVEHKQRILALQQMFTPENRAGTNLETFKGLGELLEHVEHVRGGLGADDRLALRARGINEDALEPDFRYLVCPVGPADKDGYVTITFAPNTHAGATTDDLVVDVADGAPQTRPRCSFCTLPVHGVSADGSCGHCQPSLEALAGDLLEDPQLVHEGGFKNGSYRDYERFQAPAVAGDGIYTLVGWNSDRQMIVWMQVSARDAREAISFADEWRAANNKLRANQWRTRPSL